jgi:nucleotide-binding universal stress UspA family protein
VPVDGSECSDRAVDEILKRAKSAEKLDIHLLNVQPRIFPEEATVYLDPAKMDTYYYEQGSKALASAEKRLKSGGIAYTAHRLTGPVAESIVGKARDLRADEIVMGTHGHGQVASMLLGSVAAKVLHMAETPVTLVRGRPGVDFTGRLQAT